MTPERIAQIKAMNIGAPVDECLAEIQRLQAAQERRPIDDLARNGNRWWIGNSFTGDTQAAWFSDGRWWIRHETCLAPDEHPDFYYVLPSPPTPAKEKP